MTPFASFLKMISTDSLHEFFWLPSNTRFRIICSTQMMSMSSNEFDTKGLSDEEDNDLLDNPYPVFLLTNPATILTDMATVTLLCSSSSVYHPACETHSFFRFQLFFLKGFIVSQLVTHFTWGMWEVSNTSSVICLWKPKDGQKVK